MALQTPRQDGLTGLANRRAFDQALEAEWLRAQRSRRPLSLLFVDVDISSCSTTSTAIRAATNVCARWHDRRCSGAAAVDLAALWRRGIRHHPPETDRDGACRVAERIRRR